MAIQSIVAVVCLTAALAPAIGAATLVVANKSEGTVSLVDLDSGEVLATLPVGEGPHEVAASPDGRLAVVAVYGTQESPGSTLAVIDVAQAKVVKTIDLSPHQRPHGLAFLPHDRRLLVTSETSQALLVVDLAEGRVERTIPTNQELSHMVAVTPDGRRAFVANIGSGSVSALDLEHGRHLADVATGAGAEGITTTPNGREVWVVNRAADTVSVIDATTLAVVATLDAPSFPIRAAATPDGHRVLVSCARSGDLVVIDAASRRLVRRVDLGLAAAGGEDRLFGDRFGTSSVPIGVVVAGDGARAFVAHANADRISVVDLATWRATGVLEAGKEPDGMAWTPVGVADASDSDPR